MKADVFISYKSEESDIANELVEYLEGKGIHCWIAPRDIPPGDEYPVVIDMAIDAVSAIVLVYSQKSLSSPWCKKEVRLALEYKKTIVPFKIEDVEPLRGSGWNFLIGQSQWIDAVPDPKRKFEEIAARLLGLLGRSSNLPENHVISSVLKNDRKIPVRDFMENELKMLSCNDNFYIGDNIPSKKLENAYVEMRVEEPRSDVVAIFDGTVFGSAKEGMLLTTHAAYFNCGEPFRIEWGRDASFEKCPDDENDIVAGSTRTTLVGLNKATQDALVCALRKIDAYIKQSGSFKKPEGKTQIKTIAENCLTKMIKDEFSQLASEDGVFMCDKVPLNKKENAVRSMNVREDVIVLIDGTVWGGAKEGIVLTSKGLYYKNLWQDAHRYKWQDALSIKMNDDGDEVVINGDEVMLSGVADDNVKNRIAEALMKIYNIANRPDEEGVATAKKYKARCSAKRRKAAKSKEHNLSNF